LKAKNNYEAILKNGMAKIQRFLICHVKQEDFLNALLGNDPQKNKIVQDGLSSKNLERTKSKIRNRRLVRFRGLRFEIVRTLSAQFYKLEKTE